MENLSQQQKELIEDLIGQFQNLNNNLKDNNQFNLFNVSQIMETENKRYRLKKEIELHNETMKKQAVKTLTLIGEKLDADFKNAGMLMKTQISSGGTYLRVFPINENGNQLDCFDYGDGIGIQMNAVFENIIDRINKIVGFKFSHSYDSPDNPQFEKVEDYLNSERFVNRISHMYRKYLVPKI